MTASPMNLSSVPPCSKITSTISLKYSLRSWATASGPMDSAIAVKPRMSLKRIVIGRRSPPSRMSPSWLRDLRRDVGREVALEVGADQGLPPNLLGEAAVLDADGGEPAEGHEELEVLVAEGAGRAQVVHVQEAQDLVLRRP